MGYRTGSAFGIGTPTIPLLPQTTPWGFSPYAGQGIGGQALQPYGQTLLSPLVGGGSSIGPYGISPVQIVHLLQILPQQLQQLQLLQQQQLLQLQQLVQLVPAQLQQIQQLIQLVPQQVQQLQQWQPFGAGVASPLGFGFAPQVFTGQTPGQVM